MWFIVQFEDRPDAMAVREAYLKAHLEWLDAHRDTVVLAGSISTEPGAKAAGGVWVVRAESTAAIDELLASDPFYARGLRAQHRVWCWNRAFADRTVTL
jgi:uncharacterized protein YciI